MSDYILVLVTETAFEEVIVDWLMKRREISGFTSNPINSHSREQRYVSIAEQVTGRHRKQIFQVRLRSEAVASVLRELKEQYAGTGLDYWVIPALESGRLN